MPTIYFMIGMPASGKSTWARDCIAEKRNNPLEDRNAVWLSSDRIREELYGSEEEQGDPAKVFDIMYQRTCDFINKDIDVYYDATNLHRKYRMETIKKIRDKCKYVDIYAYIMATPFEICLERNSARARTIPREVMDRMYKSFDVPSIAEGFDSIFIINSPEDRGFQTCKEVLSQSCDIPHDNDHHRLTIGVHCIAARNYVTRNWEKIHNEIGYYWTSIVEEAAGMHDIGKVYCKTFVKPNGKSDGQAHFYGHDSVSAYMFLSNINQCTHVFSIAARLDIALLINLHMARFKGEKYYEKLKALYPESVMKALKVLEDADKAAH